LNHFMQLIFKSYFTINANAKSATVIQYLF
jgi:hypothetical protein